MLETLNCMICWLILMLMKYHIICTWFCNCIILPTTLFWSLLDILERKAYDDFIKCHWYLHFCSNYCICLNPIQPGGAAIICAQLPRLIRVLITYKTDPKWFGNSSLAILCTLKWFLGLDKFLGPPGGPWKSKDQKIRYSWILENQLWSYL